MVDCDGGTDERRGGNDGSCYVYHPPIGTCSTTELTFSVAGTGPRTFTASVLDPKKNSPKP
jgi:hypothetical protein